MQCVLSAACLLSLVACSAPGLWVFEPAGSTPSQGSGAAKADPKAYADKIWDSKVVPTVSEKAVDADALFAALDKDAAAAATQYGAASTSGGAPTFMVKGSGTVKELDDSDPQGPVTVQLKNGTEVRIATGPVLTGTALRDAMGITFGEFTNQIDYQNVGTALNNKAKSEVIAKIDLKSLKGKKLAFEGAFSATSVKQALIVPTALTVS